MTDDTLKKGKTDDLPVIPDDDDNADTEAGEAVRAKEIGGRQGPEPTRYGDWEKNGRCIDF